MNRRLSFILCGLSLSFAAMAAPLSPGQALQRLKAQGVAPTRAMSVAESDLVYTALTDRGDAAMYVFDGLGNNGYVILSADDVAAPLLGYSDSGNFSPDNIPPQMKWWIEEYSRQISYARETKAAPYATRSEDGRHSVAPLMKTLWNQTAPYNNLTPLVNGKHAPTGCVATAMAQVMKYWGYPRQATGTATIALPDGTTDSFNLGRESLAWDSMLDSYSGSYSDEEAHAVAYLMKVAGYSCKMQYGADASSAFSYRAGVALIDNFSYNPKMQYCSRDYFSSADWENLIYNEVAAGRPVLYGGQSTSVGHEFVCDGYAGNGFFHFNWGWSGMSDGYFLLDSLNPDALGTGGGLGGGFNFGQDALVGVQPETADVVPPYLVQFGALSAVAFRSDVTVRLRTEEGSSSWVNTGLSELNVSIGVAFEKLQSSLAPTYVSVSNVKVGKPELVEMDGGLGMNFYGVRGELTVSVPTSLRDGDYKVTVVVKNADGDDWTPVLTLPQYSNYFYLNKTGSKITVETLEEAVVTLDKAETLTSLYYDNLAKLRIVATNNSDKDLTAGFYPKLYSGDSEKMEGDGIVITVPAHSSVTEEFYTTFRITDGSAAPSSPATYQLVWYDPIVDEYYSLPAADVTMNVTAPTPQLSIDNFGIEGVNPVMTDVDDLGSVMLYTVEGTDQVDFSFDVTSKGEFFGYPLVVAVFAMGNNRSVLSAGCAPLVISESNATASTHSYADLSGLKKSAVYVAIVFYEGPSGSVEVQSCVPVYFRLVESAGVDEVSAGSESPVKYYNMQGVEVKNPSKGMLLIRKQGQHTDKIIF